MKISLVLGSGGARGYAHIGVLQVLAERGHEVVAVSGASIGAMVGGAFAAGRLDELTSMGLKLSKTDMWLMLRPSLGAPGLVKLDRVMEMLTRVIGDVRIEDLPIPYTAVATDLISRREVWFHEGPLMAAIRASIAVPTVFSPVMLKGRLLTDGGLLNPLPVEPSLRLDADLTVAVSLFGRDPALKGSKEEVSADDVSEPGTLARLGEKIVDVLPTRKHVKSGPFDPLPSDLALGDMMTMALDVMQERIQSSRVAVNPPDVHIEVPTNLGMLFDFDQGERMIQTGRDLAIEAFDRFGI